MCNYRYNAPYGTLQYLTGIRCVYNFLATYWYVISAHPR